MTHKEAPLTTPELQAIDRATLLHPFTSLRQFASGEAGEPRIVVGGQGIRIRLRDGKELIDAFAERAHIEKESKLLLAALTPAIFAISAAPSSSLRLCLTLPATMSRIRLSRDAASAPSQSSASCHSAHLLCAALRPA